jgi:hypothetical protein
MNTSRHVSKKRSRSQAPSHRTFRGVGPTVDAKESPEQSKET